MLPGFRFFVATIVLAASILIFGLGAAALLRATHEEVAAAPSLRTIQPPVPLRPRQIETAPPTLALLRVEIPAPASEDLPTATETVTPPADEPKPAAAAVTATPPSELSPVQESAAVQADVKAPDELNEPASAEAVAPEAASAEPTTKPVAIATAPVSEATSAPAPQVSPADTVSSSAPAATPPAPTIEVAKRAAPTEAVAPPPTPIPPTPIAVGGAAVAASPPAASEPTRVVAVTATGCEILPTAPAQPGAIPEAPRAAQQPAQGTPAQNDKTAKLDPAPTGTIPTPVARPLRTTKTRKRPVVIRHRHHAPRTRVVRREVIRPQPQPDLFTILFGGGQPAPVNQPTR